jgi:hypothetical protein
MALEISSLNPTSPYSLKDVNLINPTSIETTFNPNLDYIEYVVTTSNKSFIRIDYNYNRYKFPTDGTVTDNSISTIDIDPVLDLSSYQINTGDFITTYNFYRNELLTSYTNQDLFIKDISADRTELIVRYNSNIDPVLIVNNFNSRNTGFYFSDFYLNFGDNNLVLANNISVNPDNNDILINLYQPLSNNISTQTKFWVVTAIADPLVFNIVSNPEPITPPILSFSLRGPNFNIGVNDQINNSTDYQTYNTLITSSLLSTSYNQLNNLMSSSGVEVNIDYTDFANFINFSSPVQRIKNFAYKVTQISASQAEINIINGALLGYDTSSNITILTNNINNIISNFDGYEYFLYYESSSYAWPKSNSTIPYTLFSPTSTQVINWLGNEDPYSSNYGGILSSASVYNTNNPDYLVKSIPEYLKDDPQNAPYTTFIELIGQHFDNIWIYYKDVTNLYQADNRLDYGISKDLVSQALQSFGVKLYQNNFTTQDLYSSFLGYGTLNSETTGSLPVTAGSFQDYINNYVTASYEASVTPLDDYNKEIYKRIYHNLPYLAKTKGTIPGLRALINCFGVPDTVLRISEFGGRDKDTSTYDYFDQQFNYAFDSFYDNNIGVNWLENTFELHPSWSANNNRPESIQLRLKTAGLTSTYHSQSIFTIVSGSNNPYKQAGLTLLYTGSGYASASYSGSIPSASYQFAKLDFYPDTSFPNATASVYLPFFDEGWWSVMVNKSGSTYTLYAGNSLYYDGYDGNQIGYLASSSITTSSLAWPGGSYFTLNADSFVNISGRNFTPFTGSYQELRFWARTGSVESFKDFIMNPQSIDYNGETDYANYLAHRLPLGADLITTTSSLARLTSVHPKITGSWPTTQSFSSSAYGINNTVINAITNPWYTTNVGPRFLNSPVVGLKGRVTDKIQIVDSIYPTGSVLSQYMSIAQTFPISSSESPNVNLLEIAFSPQNEINDDIIDSLGYFNIGEYIGDPRQVSSSATSYPDLNTLSYNFFQKYFDTYDFQDYVKLIKYFDNSLFKMIKDFVPARTSLMSGVVIKQHILERNKYPQPQAEWEELDYSGSIDTAFISGSTGGTFNQYNVLSSNQNYPFIISGSNFYISSSNRINYYLVSSSNSTVTVNNPTNNNFAWNYSTGELITYFNGTIELFISGTNNPPSSPDLFRLYISSSIRGTIYDSSNTSALTQNIKVINSCSSEEKFSLWISNQDSIINTCSLQFGLSNIFPYSNQTWSQYYTGSTGVSTIIHSTQDEFYDGELPGTEFVITNGELNDANNFKYPSTTQNTYTPTLYISNITPLSDFLDINTSPNQGEIYLWFDTGSFLNINPPGVPTAFTPG